MIYLSDRQRVDLMLPAMLEKRVCAALAYQQVEAGAICDICEHDILWPAITAFDAAIVEAVPDRGPAGGKIIRRAHRAIVDATAFLEERPVATAYMAAVRAVQAILDEGILILHAGSAFARGHEIFADALYERPENDEVLATVEQSARKAAERILGSLRAQGYLMLPRDHEAR